MNALVLTIYIYNIYIYIYIYFFFFLLLLLGGYIQCILKILPSELLGAKHPHLVATLCWDHLVGKMII